MQTSIVSTIATAVLLAGAVTPAAAQVNRPLQRPVQRPAPVVEPPPSRPFVNGGNTASTGNVGWTGDTIRCESRDKRRTCSADTRGGVRLVRQTGSAICVEGRNWGTDPGAIWVERGCSGEFQLRIGTASTGNAASDDKGGPSTAAIIGGVAVAGGLVALLAKSGKKDRNGKPIPEPVPTAPVPGQPAVQPAMPAPPTGPAQITASVGGVTPDARPALNMCLADAARQVGATGGSEIRLDRIDDVQPGNGGYRFRMMLGAVYPDQTRAIPTFCRATPTQVVELTFG